MTLPYFRATPAQLAINVGDVIELTGDEGRHAVTVKRLRVDEQLVVGDGQGTIATCTVTETSGKDTLRAVVNKVKKKSAPKIPITIVQAIPKGERAELSVDLNTQAGVDVIIPWRSERTIPRWNDVKAKKSREKWQKTAVEASKQSRRAWDPVVEPVAKLKDIVKLVKKTRENNGVTAILHESARISFSRLPFSRAHSIVLVIGPEGGLTPEEIEALEEAGGQAVVMGDTVLRTASAGVVALGALGVLTDRW